MPDEIFVSGSVLMHQIESAAISNAGYDYDNSMFIVQYRHTQHSVQVFFDVPHEVYKDFMQAESKARYFTTYIRGLYDSATAEMRSL